MNFSSGNPKPPQKDPVKHQSILGAMYNPHIGDSIRPLKESFRIFVNLIAMIFAMNGLFPKDHPLLKGDTTVHLTFSNVFRIAWERLSFTKQGMPKVMLFFAVVGAIACCILSIFTIFVLMFVGHAHAQTFSPPSTTQDLGWNLIDYLFNSTNESSAYQNLNSQYVAFACNSSTSSNCALPNTNLQNALWTALGFYSNALLVFAGIILFYHLISMVIDTAHSGVVMGKRANQVWAPIRLAVAILLLVPVSNGLNTGQMLVLQIAKMGSGLASNVWEVFRANLTTNSTHTIATPPSPNVTDVVVNVALMGACEYEYNYQTYMTSLPVPTTNSFIVGWTNGWTEGSTNWNFNSAPQTPDWNGSVAPYVEVNQDGSTTYHFTSNSTTLENTDICGSYTIPAPPQQTDSTQQSIANAIYQAHVSAFTSILPQIMQYVSTNAPYYICSDPNAASQCGNIPTANLSAIANIIRQYQNNLNTQINSATATGYQSEDVYTSAGWLAAGAFFNQVSNIQGVATSSASSYLPTTVVPKSSLGQFATDMKLSMQVPPTTSLPPIVTPGGGGCPPSTTDTFDMTGLLKNVIQTRLTDILLKITNSLAGQTGVWCSADGTLGIHFTGTNPLYQMAGWGHNNIELAMRFFDWGLGLMIAGSLAASSQEGLGFVTVGGAVASGASVVTGGLSYVANLLGYKSAARSLDSAANTAAMPASILVIATAIEGGAVDLGAMLLAIGAIFFTLGFLFGFLLPLLPFMHFFFGTMTWVAILFEAIVAMPLVALAHITPEGEGLPGGYAKSAYFMAFSLLLRPALMIFGLICGILILGLAASFLNMFIMGALAMTGGAGDHIVLAKIIDTIIYSTILISVANHAFQLITHIPDKAMSWIGQQGASGPAMGSPEKIERDATLASGFLGTRAASALGNTAKGVLGGMERGTASYRREVDAEKNAQAATRHQEMLAALAGPSGGGSGSGGTAGGNLGGGNTASNQASSGGSRGSDGEPPPAEIESRQPVATPDPNSWMSATGSQIPAVERKAQAAAAAKAASGTVDFTMPDAAQQAAIDAYKDSKKT